MIPSKLKKLKIEKEHFRVAIFGSARVGKKDENYRLVFQLAKLLGSEGIDIVTGGGPGTMEAANAGHKVGDKLNISHSYGLLIKLPKEQRANAHLDVKKEFTKFSERLHEFMKLSNAVVVAPGGVGTTLEFFYTLQLVQVRHVKDIPIILIGWQWKKLIEWLKENPVKQGYISLNELDSIYYVKTVDDAFLLIKKARELIENKEKNIFPRLRKYCGERCNLS